MRTLLLAVALTLSGTMAFAQQPGPRPGPGPRFGPAAFALRHARELALTPDQTRRLERVQERLEAARRPELDRLRSERPRLERADRNEQRAALEPIRREHRAAREDVLHILTPDQRKSLRGLMRQRREELRERRAVRGDRQRGGPPPA